MVLSSSVNGVSSRPANSALTDALTEQKYYDEGCATGVTKDVLNELIEQFTNSMALLGVVNLPNDPLALRKCFEVIKTQQDTNIANIVTNVTNIANNAMDIAANEDNIEINRTAAAFNKCISYAHTNPKNDMEIGVNLEGLTFGTGATDFFEETEEVVDYYISRGIKYFRVGFQWERIQPTLNADLDVTHLGVIQTLFDYILSQGGRVIADLHNYAERIVGGVKYQVGSAEVPYSALDDFWIKFSEFYGNNNNVDYCIMNEPRTLSGAPTLEASDWADAMQNLVINLRDNNVGNKLQISGIFLSNAYAWFSQNNNKAFENFYDPANNFVLEVHSYDDVGRDGGGVLSVDDISDGVRNIKLFTDWCRKYGFKAHLGESGISHSDEKSRLAWWRKTQYMEENKDVWESTSIWGGGRAWSMPYENSLYAKTGNQNFPDDPINMQKVSAYLSKLDNPHNMRIYADFSQGTYHGIYDHYDMMSISRPSKGVAIKKDGNLETFLDNEFRITDLGLLVEEKRTNLIKSVNFDYDGGSVLYDVTIEHNYPAPDGSNNAILLVDNANDARHHMRIVEDLILNENYVFSVFCKYIDFDLAHVYLGNPSSGNDIVNFKTPSAEDGGFNWVRGVARMADASNVSIERLGFGFAPDTSPDLDWATEAYAGTGSKIGFFHPQLENADFPTSPIVGYDDGSVREADTLAFTKSALNILTTQNFTILFELLYMPDFAVICEVLKLDDVSILQRETDGSYSTSLGGGLQTGAPVNGRNQATAGQRVALSVNRSTNLVILHLEGEVTVSSDVAAVGTATTASLGLLNGFVKIIGIEDEAFNQTALEALVNDY